MPRPLDVGFMMMPTENAETGVAPRWSEILQMALRGEELGYNSLWIPDHLIIDIPREGSQPEGAWEAWPLVAALAAATKRIQIGLLVTCTAFRNPALLAKIADTCDEISGGRAHSWYGRRLVPAGVRGLWLSLRSPGQPVC